jgi:tRNA-dihydrouridine synthase A
MLGLVHGLPGARKFRRILTEGAIRPGAGVEVVREALAALKLEYADIPECGAS